MAKFESNGGLRGYKRNMYEGGVRVPMIAYWPGTIKAGMVSHVPTAVWDYFSTFCQLAGVQPGTHQDGVSMVPLFKGANILKRSHLYWELHDGGVKQAVLKGKWKGVRPSIDLNKPLPPIELYDLDKDPKETTDVSAANPEVVRELEAIMASEHIRNPRFQLPGE